MNLQIKPINYSLNHQINLLHSITRKNSGLEYIEVKVLELKEAAEIEEINQDLELCVVALTGKITVSTQRNIFEHLGTRQTVFDKIPTDSVYVGIGEKVKIMAESDCRLLFAYAPTDKKLPTTLIKHTSGSIEQRGKYQNQRLVQNILTDQDTISDKLLVVEVYTNGGNFSSYPPHKHDQNDLPNESLLEETYYHEIDPEQGFVFQRVYTDDRLVDQAMAVENKDIVLVPKGYHPVGVPDGYTSYYLNVMAGPEKKWVFHDDPAHSWILKRN